MRFIYTRGEQGVSAWEVTEKLDSSWLDREKYIELMARAASSVLYPFGIENEELKQWAHSATIMLPLKFERQDAHVRPICNHVRPGRVERHAGVGRRASRSAT
jgi:hypothetical protein